MEADTPKRKHRWFQFSLRTLLIVVTLLAVVCSYVGWQANVVRDREALTAVPQALIEGVGWSEVSNDGIPLVRRWLGDKKYLFVILNDTAPPEFLERYRAAFPEAMVLPFSDAKKIPRKDAPWPTLRD